MNKILTIFTPTYNRGSLLRQLYRSLINQTNKEFVWLIIDDGSKDDTEEIVKLFNSENKIKIIYKKQENGGKHRAFNQAIKICNTEIFMCVDSDDYLLNNAVEIIINRYNEIKSDDNISGFAGLCVDKKGEIIGGYPSNGLISDTLNIRDIYNLPGEPEIYKMKYLKNYKFEEFKGEKFITEAVLFDKLTYKYKLKYYNDKLMVKEYLEGGLTDNQLKIRIDSIKGTIYYYNQRCGLSTNFKGKIRAVINYIRFSIHDSRYFNIFKGKNKILKIITIPISILLVIKDKLEMKRRYKNEKTSISN